MYRKVFFFSTLSLLIIIACISFGCSSKDPAKEIIGTWVVVKEQPGAVNTKALLPGQSVPKSEEDLFKGVSIEFFSDKTYIAKGSLWQGFVTNGQWTILDDGRIKLQDMGHDPFVVIIKENQMIFDISIGIYSSYKIVLEKKPAR